MRGDRRIEAGLRPYVVALGVWAVVLVAAFVLAGCGGTPVEPRRVIPMEEEGVWVGAVPVTRVDPVDGYIQCAVAYDGVAVCWLVRDSLPLRP